MATKTNYEANGSTYFRIRHKVEMADGSTKVKAFYGKSKKDANDKYKTFLEEQAKLKYYSVLEKDNATLGARAEEYVTNVLAVSQKYSKGTIQAYVGAWKNHVKDAPIAEMKVSDIKPIDIQKFYNSLDVSQQTLKRVNKFMKAFWKWMVLNSYASAVMDAVEIPKKEDNSRHDGIIVWEDEEIAKIQEALQNPHRLSFLIYTLLYTGMRISEVLGLKYGDIEGDYIHVTRQYYLGELKEPKFGSARIIPLHEVLKEQLPIHKAWHTAESEKRGYKTDFVFTTNNGRLYDRSSVRSQLRRFYEANNIPYKHIHAYRATFCTNMCRCDVPLEVASKLLGHKSLEVTAQHYALVRQESLDDAMIQFTYNHF